MNGICCRQKCPRERCHPPSYHTTYLWISLKESGKDLTSVSEKEFIRGSLDPEAGTGSMNTMGQVCTLAFLGMALKSLYILESPKPMVLAFFCKPVQLSSLLYAKKRRGRKFVPFHLMRRGTGPYHYFIAKQGTGNSEMLVIQTVTCKTYI